MSADKNSFQFTVLSAEANLMKRFVILVLGFAAAMFGFGATASAYPLQFLIVTVSDADLDPGQQFDVTVAGCQVGEIVEFRLEDSLATAICSTPRDDQSFLSNITVRYEAVAQLTAPIELGPYVGIVTVHTQNSVIDADFSVLVDAEQFVPTSATQSPIPQTNEFAILLTRGLLGLLFLVACAIAYWFLFLRERDDADSVVV